MDQSSESQSAQGSRTHVGQWIVDVASIQPKHGVPFAVLTVALAKSGLVVSTVVRDRFSRKDVVAAVQAIVESGPAPRSMVVDRGLFFSSTAFRDLCRRNGVTLVDGCIRCVRDKSNAERFLSRLQDQFASLTVVSLSHARHVIAGFVETYNSARWARLWAIEMNRKGLVRPSSRRPNGSAKGTPPITVAAPGRDRKGAVVGKEPVATDTHRVAAPE